VKANAAASIEVADLTKVYRSPGGGTFAAVNHLSFQARPGRIFGLLGPNGAGKTTTLRAIAGLVQWDRENHGRGVQLGGNIDFKGEALAGLPPHLIAAKGLILCPERRRPFREMRVVDNLKAGAFLIRDSSQQKELLDNVYTLFPRLKERERQIAGTLSGGEQQMLAIGRSLMSAPTLLAIDEPSTGLAPLIRKDLFERIADIKTMGIAVLLVEQDANVSFKLADRNYLLSNGRIVAQGSSEDLLQDETVRRAYLGV
jgi:branched-chain amino acid transport system ATP-binding protein